jgi:hypothetical protein
MSWGEYEPWEVGTTLVARKPSKKEKLNQN